VRNGNTGLVTASKVLKKVIWVTFSHHTNIAPTPNALCPWFSNTWGELSIAVNYDDV
jgi:hypothetical protein